jgi:hypothetical protein
LLREGKRVRFVASLFKPSLHRLFHDAERIRGDRDGERRSVVHELALVSMPPVLIEALQSEDQHESVREFRKKRTAVWNGNYGRRWREGVVLERSEATKQFWRPQATFPVGQRSHGDGLLRFARNKG